MTWLARQLDRAARDWAALPHWIRNEGKPRIRVKAGREPAKSLEETRTTLAERYPDPRLEGARVLPGKVSLL